MTDAPRAVLLGPDGSPKGDVDLDASVFGIEPNVAVMHQVVRAQLAAARAGTHSTKTRAQVRGGGRKPWRQKGIGRARHGSNRSPQWTGGGVVHGPQPRSYRQRVNKRVRRLALRSALSIRAASDAVKVVEALDWESPRTRRAVEFLQTAGIDGKVMLVVAGGERTAALSFRNLDVVTVCPANQLNTRDVLWAHTIVFSVDGLAAAFGDGAGYDVSDGDFVREEDATESTEDAVAATEDDAA